MPEVGWMPEKIRPCMDLLSRSRERALGTAAPPASSARRTAQTMQRARVDSPGRQRRGEVADTGDPDHHGQPGRSGCYEKVAGRGQNPAHDRQRGEDTQAAAEQDRVGPQLTATPQERSQSK